MQECIVSGVPGRLPPSVLPHTLARYGSSIHAATAHTIPQNPVAPPLNPRSGSRQSHPDILMDSRTQKKVPPVMADPIRQAGQYPVDPWPVSPLPPPAGFPPDGAWAVPHPADADTVQISDPHPKPRTHQAAAMPRNRSWRIPSARRVRTRLIRGRYRLAAAGRTAGRCFARAASGRCRYRPNIRIPNPALIRQPHCHGIGHDGTSSAGQTVPHPICRSQNQRTSPTKCQTWDNTPWCLMPQTTSRTILAPADTKAADAQDAGFVPES